MNDLESVRQCKICSKKLLDEKIPLCIRCRIEGRNKATSWGGKAVSAAGAVTLIANMASGNKNTPSKKI